VHHSSHKGFLEESKELFSEPLPMNIYDHAQRRSRGASIQVFTLSPKPEFFRMNVFCALLECPRSENYFVFVNLAFLYF